MYGINNQMMDRIQKRLRQKIYREMIQQQQKYKQEIKRRKSYREDQQYSNKTQPKQDDLKYSRQLSRSYKFQEPQRNLEHQSTYLPVIAKKKLKTQDNQKTINYDYQNYLNRRKNIDPNRSLSNNKEQQIPNLDEASQQQTIINGNDNNFEESDDEKTQQYLKQCQKIINSLKELTNKNGRKIKPKQSKYDVDVPFINKKPPLKNMDKQTPTQKIYSSTPKNFKLSSVPSRSNNKNNRYELNEFQSQFKPLNSQAHSLNMQENQFNQFNFNTNQLKLNLKLSGIRQNTYKIEPLKGKEPVQDPNSNQKEQNSAKKKKIQKNGNPQTNNMNSKVKEKPKKNENEKVSNEKKKKQQPQQNQIQKQAKKQNAIIKYLKKARVCGNLLIQKVEGHKKNGEEEESPSPDNKEQSP